MRKNNEIMKAAIFWTVVLIVIVVILWNTPEMYR